jgi:glycosyltransferase involved in cell wall biosynthesis
MVEKYYEGNQVVYGVRSARDTDTFFKKFTAESFYKFMKVMGADVVYNHADFRLMSKRSLEAFAEYPERNLFLRGIVPLIGFKTDSVYYERLERVAGESKYPLKKMIALAIEGITSFSVKPIQFITFFGIMIVVLSFLALIYVLVSYFFLEVNPGWASTFLSIWFIGGVQLISIGLIGQYIGKIYIEVKQRPRYHIATFLSSETEE